MLGGMHWYDLLPLVVVALLFFGPKRLPEMGSSIGKTIKEFQKSMREVHAPEADATTAAVTPPTQATAALPASTPVVPTVTSEPVEQTR